MKIALLGGLRVEHEGTVTPVTGAMQLALLFRLAADAGTAVSYRAIAEDLWSADAPVNTRGALQSIVSRLRAQLPADVIESTAGGYRLAVARADVDALLFQDLVSAAQLAPEPAEAARLATRALTLWTGEPWMPSEDFDWFERDLRADRARAIELGGVVTVELPTDPLPSIPVPLTGLVGRERELQAIADQLAANRLVTLIGTGGAGKTRLAIETASTVRGANLVELAPVTEAELWQTIFAATRRDLRTAEGSTDPVSIRQRAVEALSGRPVLLVLDNCEHVIDAVARVALELLTALPELRILATSREALGIPGEAFVTLGSLGHPGQELIDAGLTAAQLCEYPAIELFRRRAVAARGSELNEAELTASAAICLRLDGLPLAIELAAAKLRTMTVDEVLRGLEHRFALLTGGARGFMPRHQTLRAMIDWSWSLLDHEERIALAGLAVFPSGVDASEASEAAQVIGVPSPQVFDALVDKSLVQRSRGRFRTLETIREYGVDRLMETGGLERARDAQAEFAARRAEEHDPQLRGPGIHAAIAWFDAEEDNLIGALRYTVAAGRAEPAVRLVGACAWYWVIRDRNDEAQEWFMTVSPLARGMADDGARVIAAMAPVAEVMMSPEPADEQQLFRAVFGALGDVVELRVPAGGHELLQVFGAAMGAFTSLDLTGDWRISIRAPRGEDLGLDPWPTAILNLGRASLAQNRGDVEELGEASGLAVEQFTAIGDTWALAIAQQMRAEWLTLVGRYDEALRITDESTANIRQITSSADLMQQQQLAVTILARQGDVVGARARAATLVDEAVASGSRRAIAQAAGIATTMAALDGDERAAVGYAEIMGEVDPELRGAIGQVSALQSLAWAYVEFVRRDVDAAELRLRVALDAAVGSHDHPVISVVTVGLARLCLERGDAVRAARALELADAIRGIADETDPWVIRVRAGVRKAGIERSGTEVPDRPIPALAELLP